MLFGSVIAVIVMNFILGAWIILGYHTLLPDLILLMVGLIPVVVPAMWIGTYRLHKRFQRLRSKLHSSDDRQYLREVQSSAIGPIISANILLAFSLMAFISFLELIRLRQCQ